MQKRKGKSNREVTFTAPFAFRTCQQRLQKKAQGWRWARYATRIEIDRVNDEFATFHLRRGPAYAKGRFDKLSDKSTLVNFTAKVNWFKAIPKVAFAGLVPFAVFMLGMLNAYLNYWAWQYSQIRAPEPNPEVAISYLYIACGCAFLAALVFIRYRAIATRNGLAREIEATLTDQLTDLPNFDLLEQDGEIVYTQALPIVETSEVAAAKAQSHGAKD